MFKLKPLLCSAALLLTFTATAHTPYLAPASFEPLAGWVTLDAAFAEKFFVPEVAFDQSEFKVLQPDGKAVAPKELAFVSNLPKTRSGKILRRLLKAKELGLPEGDISTLEQS